MEILVSDDEEDEEINKKFTFYPKIQLLNKLKKKMLLYIINNNLCDCSPNEIYSALCQNGWKLEESVNQLNSQV